MPCICALARPGTRRELHSFPTRRSSDLDENDIKLIAKKLGLSSITDAKNRDGDRRSEEHTSELQSLRHLVCRLLLEKKNGQPLIVVSIITSPAFVTGD